MLFVHIAANVSNGRLHQYKFVIQHLRNVHCCVYLKAATFQTPLLDSLLRWHKTSAKQWTTRDRTIRFPLPFLSHIILFCVSPHYPRCATSFIGAYKHQTYKTSRIWHGSSWGKTTLWYDTNDPSHIVHSNFI